MRMEKMDLSLLMNNNIPDDSPKCSVDTKKFCEQLSELLSKYNIGNTMQSFIEKIQSVPKVSLWRKDTGLSSFYFTEKYENKFFMSLLGHVNEGTILTKYTNTDGLKRMCNDNECSMVSLVGMNDSKECTYATQYMEDNGYNKILDLSQDILIGTSSFITSFTTKDDDLAMWRLYGNDAKGVAIHYKTEELPQDFYLAPVSYADKEGNHPELLLLVEMTKIMLDNCNFCFKNLYKWRYFFKSHEYNVEDEIRLLYISDKLNKNSKWITTGAGVIAPLVCFPIVDNGDSYQADATTYPLHLVGTSLGPQFPEQSKNIETIRKMFKTKFGWTETQFKVSSSKISNYKNN